MNNLSSLFEVHDFASLLAAIASNLAKKQARVHLKVSGMNKWSPSAVVLRTCKISRVRAEFSCMHLCFYHMRVTRRGSLLWRAYRKQARDAAWHTAGSTANFTQCLALFLFFESGFVPLL